MQIFISYARKDGSDYAHRVAHEIEKYGLKPWIDNESIGLGEDWRQRIDDAIQKSFALVLIVTPEAMLSDYVTYEWIFALGAGIKVIPLIFVKPQKLHPKIDVLNWGDFTDIEKRRWDLLINELKEARNLHNPFRSRLPTNTPPFVKEALDNLESTDEKVRRKAIDDLSKYDHSAAVEAIAGAVRYPLKDVQIYAAFTLAAKTKYDDQRAIPGLLEALRSHNDDDRRKAARELKQCGEDSIQGLLAALTDSFSETRFIAAVTLGELKEKSAISTLLTLLDDQHSKVVSAAFDALDAIGDTGVISALQDRLAKSDEHTQIRIAKILIKLGDYSVQGHLLKLLKSTNSDSVIRPAAELLLQIPSDNVPGLIATLKEARSLFGRAIAAEMLGVLRNRTAIPQLVEALDDKDGYVRRYAAIALGNIGAVEAISKITQQLDDIDLNARHGAEAALQIMGTEEAMNALKSWWQNGRIEQS